VDIIFPWLSIRQLIPFSTIYPSKCGQFAADEPAAAVVPVKRRARPVAGAKQKGTCGGVPWKGPKVIPVGNLEPFF
jgi:hypothetical protein